MGDAEVMRVKLQQKLDLIQSRAKETIAMLNQHPGMKMEIQETIDQMVDSILPVETLNIPSDDDDKDTIDDGGLVDPQQPQVVVDPPQNMASAAAWDGLPDYDNTEGGTL